MPVTEKQKIPKTQQQKSTLLYEILIMPFHVLWLRSCIKPLSPLFCSWGILCWMGSTTAGWIFVQLVINMSRAMRAQIRANALWKTDEKSMRPASWVSLAFMTYHACLPLVTQLFLIVLSYPVRICVQEVLDGFLTFLSFKGCQLNIFSGWDTHLHHLLSNAT